MPKIAPHHRNKSVFEIIDANRDRKLNNQKIEKKSARILRKLTRIKNLTQSNTKVAQTGMQA
jgi:hypothetical protein